MSKTISFQMTTARRSKTLRSGDYWAVLTLCAILSFILLVSSGARI